MLIYYRICQGISNQISIFWGIRAIWRSFLNSMESQSMVSSSVACELDRQSHASSIPWQTPIGVSLTCLPFTPRSLFATFSRGARATGSELKRAPRWPNRRKPLEIQGFSAKSREHSLSAFCVSWLTGSFRARNLSVPYALILEQTPNSS